MSNLLLKGDNINSLHYLINNNKKFEVIYIDPPYNTTLGDLGYSDKLTKSQWSKFMYDRLNLAKEVLSDDGFIFISIDEKSLVELNESECLRLIFDTMDKVRNGGKVIIPSNTYNYLSYGREGAEELMLIKGLTLEAPIGLGNGNIIGTYEP